MRSPRMLVLLVALVSWPLLATGVRAQDAPPAGVAMTPDGLQLLVNKQLGSERWTISVGLADDAETDGVPRITSLIGNVFRVDAEDVSFVHCQVEPGSTGSLADPASVFRLRCKATGACRGGAPPCEDSDTCGALACARDAWTTVATGLEIPADFLLPPEGLVGTDDEAGFGDRVARLLSDVVRWLAERSAVALPEAAHAQSTFAASTMSIDLLHHLVVRDVGDERWSIVLDMRRDEDRAGGYRIATATGNVFGEGMEPSFLFCEPAADSVLTLEDESADLVFTCLGTTACATSALACSAEWTRLPEAVRVTASFFLPDGGRGSPATSSRGLGVLGARDRLPSIASPEFHLPGQSGQPAEDACVDGAACIVSRIGLCEEVPGRQLSIDGTCNCLVDGVTPHCVRCGTEPTARIPAACGEPCEFDVGRPLGPDGESTGILNRARGVCLPLDADSPHCFCHAIPRRRVHSTVACGSRVAPCASDGCCIDDPRDGCLPVDGDLRCPGMCVVGIEGAEPDRTCGVRTHAFQTCGDGVVHGSELCDPADASSSAGSCDALGLAGDTFACSACKPVGCANADAAPELVLDLPDSLPQYGRTPIAAAYADTDGDVAALVLVATDGTEYRWAIPDASGRSSGDFEFALGCNGSTGAARFEAFLVDDGDNRSESVQIDLSCVASALVCGDGERTDGEACDGSAEGGSGCAEGTLCANDCSACHPADSCRGRCCPAAGAFCAPAGPSCACDPECGARSDCCTDAGDECGL